VRKELTKRLQTDFTFMKPGSKAHGKYGCEVSDGWFDLLYKMCTEIQATGRDFTPVQIKQKYGRLRVYYKMGDARVDEIVEKYEELSEFTCEECGNPGVYRKEQIIVLCDKCLRSIAAKRGDAL
jgi:ribosomal protein L37AE/L43A